MLRNLMSQIRLLFIGPKLHHFMNLEGLMDMTNDNIKLWMTVDLKKIESHLCHLEKKLRQTEQEALILQERVDVLERRLASPVFKNT